MTIASKSFQPSESKIIIIAPTVAGCHQALQLWDGLQPLELWTREDTLIAVDYSTSVVVQGYSDSLAPVVTDCWGRATQLVFFLPVGAVVRLIAPLLNNKYQDAGVVAIDDTGKFVVSVSGAIRGGPMP